MSLNVHHLTDTWQKKWPSCAPAGEELRTCYEEKWVRFYTLPGGKRYAENENEYDEIIARHDVLLNELCSAKTIIVIISKWDENDAVQVIDIQEAGQNFTYWQSLDESVVGSKTYRHLYASQVSWEPGALDDLIKMTASNKLSGVIFTTDNLDWLYHPYDGGVDVVLETPERRDMIKRLHEDWIA
jgi:hypothetical protein